MNRKGTSIVELIVALTLGAVVVMTFATTVVGQRRSERALANAAAHAGAADEAARVLSSLIARAATSDSFVFRSDTALEWFTAVGVSMSCAAGGDSIVLPDSASSSWWESWPDTGDAVDAQDAAGNWTRHEIIGIRSRTAGTTCGGPQHAVVVRAPHGLGVAPLVRVARRMRFMLYRGTDGAWWLGERTCTFAHPVLCGAAQPVAGPLAPPPTGLQFVLDSTRGVMTVSIRTPGGPGRTVSVVITP
jgi:hypothetical protein